MERIKSHGLLLILLTLLPVKLLAYEECRLAEAPYSNEVEALSEQMEFITGEISTKVLGIKVNYDGTGTVKVLTDDAGNLLGIRLDYKDSKNHTMQQTRTVEEFNKGESVAFVMEGQKNNPLILKTKPKTVLSKQNGGSFTFSLLTDKDPAKYVDYQLSLVRVGNSWKVMKGDKAVSSTVIAPNISYFQWEGTFKSASFQ